MLTENYDRALVLCTHLHRNHTRKGSRLPYVSHLLSVSALVLEDGGTEDEAIAGLLHDALEDCPEQITADDIAAEFGPTVRDIVVACTDTPAEYSGGQKPPWRQRKEAYLSHLRASKVSFRVSLADKLHNMRSIHRDYHDAGPLVWERFSAPEPKGANTLWYYQSLAAAYRDRGATGFMVDELERLTEALALAQQSFKLSTANQTIQ